MSLLRTLQIDRAFAKMGHPVNPKRVYTSIPNAQNEVYPYLLKDIEINRPNQVWCADITYIRVKAADLCIWWR